MNVSAILLNDKSWFILLRRKNVGEAETHGSDYLFFFREVAFESFIGGGGITLKFLETKSGYFYYIYK